MRKVRESMGAWTSKITNSSGLLTDPTNMYERVNTGVEYEDKATYRKIAREALADYKQDMDTVRTVLDLWTEEEKKKMIEAAQHKGKEIHENEDSLRAKLSCLERDIMVGKAPIVHIAWRVAVIMHLNPKYAEENRASFYRLANWINTPEAFHAGRMKRMDVKLFEHTKETVVVQLDVSSLETRNVAPDDEE